MSIDNESVTSSARLNLQHLIDMNVISGTTFDSLSSITQDILRSPVGHQFSVQIDTPSAGHTLSTPHTLAATTASPVRSHRPTTMAERITQRVIDAYGIIEPILFENRRTQSPGSI